MSKISDHKILIFDVYGTLADWETGLFDALQPLLKKYSASRSWSRKDSLTAFSSVETDLQAQYPTMLYSDLLVKSHEVLEERLKALATANPAAGGGTGSTLAGDVAPSEAEATSSEGAGSSAAANDLSTDSSAPARVGTDAHKAFGSSIREWPIFADTSDALHRLSKHFKLVVLSNVDRESFKYTHALLSEGLVHADLTQEILKSYTYPDPNPNRFWHPQETTPKSRSPFTLILTAQDTGCYKPATGGFTTALQYLSSQSTLTGNLSISSNDADGIKSKVLVVAQSLTHDHEPAHQLGIKSVWIDRPGAVTCNERPGGSDAKTKWTWRFDTLGAMADELESETASSSQ
ncbi:HAD-like domain-containing protein [Crepidotus variabilis]|uniref:HAD-like domain-containing protein n=1 Tax=Crepidotus variabilis TaxID=179855 RepID=A0A9P6E5S0_9AGAR|nr:HAD-like domain-containing protein [Crepidotus variabilis]